MKKKFWTSDKLVGLIAILISFITLIIFVKQTNIIDKQSRLSVMPYLMISTSEVGSENKFFLKLINYGVGPAVIDSTAILYKDKRYNTQLVNFLETHVESMDSIPILNWATMGKGLAIPAGGERTIITIGGTKESYDAFMEVYKDLREKGLNFEIRYRSIYDDMWQITSYTDLPEKLDP